MTDLVDRIRSRVLPALLTALGVVFLTGGLLSLTSPVTADPLRSPSPTIGTSAEPTETPLITFPPFLSDAAPSTSPTPPADRVATRVRIAALEIDLPVILQKTRKVPCNVAMYTDDPAIGQPGEGRATYLYAHAREGMFLPLLDASKVKSGEKLLGMVVEVWTSDDQRFLYEITEVRRHVPPGATGFIDPMAATKEELWLQTSEGVGEAPKLQLVAKPLSQDSADHDEANPKAKPIICT